MARRGKVDMMDGWAIEDTVGLANVATNKAEAKSRELPSIDGTAIFPSEVSSPLVQTETLASHGTIIGPTGTQAAHVAALSSDVMDFAASVAKVNAVIVALENVGILAKA